MGAAYAKIDMTNPGSGIGTIMNTQMMIPSVDTFDPSFTWAAIQGLYCQDGSAIQIGCTYDGTNFYPQVSS